MTALGWWFVVLSAVFTAKHFLGDFLFQTRWMSMGKEQVSGWLAPLATHSAIHAGLTGAIVLSLAPRLWPLMAVDFLLHGAIDRTKGIVTKRLGLTAFTDTVWWWVFGADQTLHHLTHLAFVALLVSA